jgi:hypothetical protein
LALGCFLLAAVASAAPPQAPGAAADDLLASAFQRPEPLATAVFVGTPSADPVQYVTGYDEGVYTQTWGSSIDATPEAIVLDRTGLYQVHVEGNLFFASGDPTGNPEAAGIFGLLINGNLWVQCAAPTRASAVPVPTITALDADHDRVSQCDVSIMIEVHADGSRPLTFPRHSELQVVLLPNDRPLGDATLELVRVEVTRLGP